MSLKLNTPVKITAAIFASFLLATSSQAVMPEPIGEMQLVNMSFDQRLAHVKEVHADILKSTPQEIIAYWNKRESLLAKLSPAEVKQIIAKAQANARAITPEQNNAFKAEQKAYFAAMNPEQRAAVKASLDDLKSKQKSLMQ